jgi:hypothetical protein
MLSFRLAKKSPVIAAWPFAAKKSEPAKNAGPQETN